MQTKTGSITRIHRSKGCLMCRRSKVKCNEVHPQCSRCARRGTECSYPDALELNFRDENSKAAARAAALWRTRTQAARLLHEPSAPSRTLEDLHSRVLAAFYRDFDCSAKVSNPWIEFFQMLPTLYRRSAGQPSSPTREAIRALAMAHHSRQQQYPVPQLEIMARTEYLQAITQIRLQLQRSHGIPSTETVVSVTLMGLFDSILPSPDPVHSWHGAHQHGAISMVRQQIAAPSSAASIDPYLLKYQYLLMVINCLNHRSQPQLPLKWWAAVMDPGFSATHLFCTMYRLAQWQAEIDSFILTFDHHALSEMIEKLHAADEALEAWEAQLSPSAHFSERDVRADDPTILQWPGAPSRVYVYKSSWNAVPLTFCFATRIVLYQNVLMCHGYDEHAEQIIVEMIRHICRSTSAVLSGGDGSTEAEEGLSMRGRAIVWPLNVASSALQSNPRVLEKVGLDAAQWTRRALQHVLRLSGSSLALMMD
ncbi:Zn(II)2Cys6 transcription factor domain-containing protein [Aspergillus saccharolyticus JOP 1030-1]|uniref:Zn(2)-C6 fungal-type domain-containing protein n=1 Tax=Aspergillus saccharolyticus JOP 1030-1 TaxID=1450539 RepID=A0A318ZNW6_9EURO|nr:hypothetical protein BP01DRAFT_388359 [Aspergillus saccharolyticus JOP 1030-1]PYH49289.1 hypothetical protein BP01DRAFT_388359 [Aspergillus saccharolyticus JOP 1030-1]